MTQQCSQNHHCLRLNVADQSKIFISLNLFYLENFLPLLVSMVHNLFKTCEKTSFSQASLCHKISFYRILWLFFIASWISLKRNPMDFIASCYWPSHPPTYYLNLVCRISHYFTILLPSESFICHPLSQTSSLMLHLPINHTCPASCPATSLKIFCTMACTRNLLIISFPKQ